MELGEQIKTRRKELNITQQELADRLGVPRPAVSNWETNKNYPDLQLIVQISEVLQLSLDVLLKGDSNVVERIAKDTKDSLKNKRKVRIMTVLFVCLLLAVSAMVYFILFWTGEINDANQIRDMRIENNELIIDVDTPWYYGKRLWYIDLDETKTIANVTIKYNFGKSRAGNDELRAPVNSDKDEPFTRETMQSLKEIRVVTSSGKVVKTLVITNSMRENFRDDR